MSSFILKFIIWPLHSMTYPNSLDMSANNRPHAVLATKFLWCNKSVFILKFIFSPLHSMTYPNSRDMSANNRPHAVLATTFLWWTPHLARPPMTLAMEQCSENASRASLASYRMNLIFQKWKIVTLLSWNHLLFWSKFLNF